MCIQKVQPNIINTNNRNLNIKYNERLVKDIRKDEREKTLKAVKIICNRIVHEGSGDIAYGELIIELNKLK
jgi:hypothetical protein